MARPKKSSPERSFSLAAENPVALPRGLRVSDAAKYAGVTHWFIRSAVWTGKLRAYRAGKVLVILRDDLDRWLNSLPEVQPLRSQWIADRQQKGGAA